MTKLSVYAIFVLKEESTSVITKCLNIIKSWNTEASQKYALRVFDESKITALELVFSGVHNFFCAFYKEQTWNRNINKIENNVYSVSECVKSYMR